MDAIETIEHNGCTIKIFPDDPVESPREWGCITTMVCFHRRYNLGDTDHGFSNPEELWEFLDENPAIDLPLFLYDHSGITMNTTGFSCPWDSGQVGIIYVTLDTVRKEYNWKRITKQRRQKILDYLKQEVEIYDMYLTGDVYGFQIVDKWGDVIDSCWGFYGYDHEKSGLMESARDACESYQEQWVVPISGEVMM